MDNGTTAPDHLLIQSKLVPPQLLPGVVERPGLVQHVGQYAARLPLLLLTAPAGYGKTTLLAQWVAQSDVQSAWISLSPEDNEWGRFFYYLMAAWAKVNPQLANQPLGLLLNSRTPDPQAVKTALINAALAMQSDIFFILDDYHHIHNDDIHSSIDFLIENAPSNLHFILAARGQPPLQLARYRGSGRVWEWGPNALRLDPVQQTAFLQECLPETKMIEDWQERLAPLEGWPAGLRLVCLAISKGLLDPQDLEVSGDQRFMAEYLQTELVGHLSKDDQDFLLQTGFLHELNESLCRAVTEKTGGLDRLDRLMRDGLLIQPLDANGEEYRFHPLLADFLSAACRKRDPRTFRTLQCKAARWHLAQGHFQRAFDFALAAGDIDLTMTILDQSFITMLMSGRVVVVEGWLKSLPIAWKSQHPLPRLVQAGVSLIQGHFQDCRQQLDLADELALRLEFQVERYQARTAAMRCNVACFQNDLSQAKHFADLALEKLAVDDLDFRAGIFGALGDTYRRHGQWKEANAAYSNVLHFERAPTFAVQKVHVFGALADLEMLQGRLRKADAYWQKASDALKESVPQPGQPLPLAGWVNIRQAELAYERNQLDLAHQELEKGRARVELGQDLRGSIAAALLETRLSWAEGQSAIAEKHLERSRSMIGDSDYPGFAQRWMRNQLLVWASTNDQQSLRDWLDGALNQHGHLDEVEAQLDQHNRALTMILVGQGQALERWLRESKGWLAKMKDQGLAGHSIELMALQAMALHQLGSPDESMQPLETALRLAEPEGYRRLFVDLGPLMADLLNEACKRRIMPAYSRRLLKICRQAAPYDIAPKVGLPETLTAREIEVVRWMAKGLTNPEIGQRLVIAPGTVKKHAANIYSKLGVSNRTQAAALAKELGLIE